MVVNKTETARVGKGMVTVYEERNIFFFFFPTSGPNDSIYSVFVQKLENKFILTNIS